MRYALMVGLLAVIGWATPTVFTPSPATAMRASALVNTAPYGLAGGSMVYGKKKHVQLTWSDSSTAIIRTDVQRRSLADTTWKRLGYTTGGYKSWIDPYIHFGNTYKYRLRDSTSGQVLTGWSDSLVVVVVER